MSKFPIRLFFGFIAVAMLCTTTLRAQVGLGELDVDYRIPKEFTIGGITVSGAKNLDSKAIILFSGLSVGETITIPGEEISK
ncbi:MAG TPA: hypothetical protein VJ949_14330, partial [Cryomorphaceae bacterium]|nr:hypothetical protein [Cryomorphaceae bacterium]